MNSLRACIRSQAAGYLETKSRLSEIGAVLTVGIDDDDVEPAIVGTATKFRHPARVELGRQLGYRIGHAEMGEFD
jgi:hypothetical protein